MKRTLRILYHLAVLAAWTLSLAGPTILAQPEPGTLPALPATTPRTGSAGYHLSWWAVGGGSGSIGAGPYTLRSAAGQPYAGTWSGGSYTLDSGFRPGIGATYATYLPLALKNY